MRRRDDFLQPVKHALAGRAGFRCSICTKPTSGPGDGPAAVLSDGIAAHITAAAPDGPRFDATLTADQRQSIDNGIWACTQHGREIDSDAFAFSVDLLRGLKREREQMAKREMERATSPEDATGALVEFPYAATTTRLFEIFAPQDYVFGTTSSASSLLLLGDHPERIINLAPDVIIETWETYPNVAGILATLLSSNIELWEPSPEVLAKLEDLCARAIRADDWSQAASIEPLAFAIAGKGRPRVHRDVLERLIASPAWRDADAKRIRKYYGTIGNEIAAVFRHWNSELRSGLLKANDAARLIDLLLSNDKTLRSGQSRRSLIDLLRRHVVVLRESGEPKMAKTIHEFVEAFGHTERRGPRRDG